MGNEMQGIRATVVGNLTADPDVRQVNGKSVANFDVAVNDGYKDKDSGQWVDKGTTFVRVTFWGSIAEHVGDTLRKGFEVVLSGSLRLEEYQTKEGQTRHALVLDGTEVGASLRWAVGDLRKVSKPASAAPFLAPAGIAEPTAPLLAPQPAPAPGVPF